ASSMTEAPSVRELDITLERNSPVPLYYQLAQSIEHAINTGALAPGDRLENELSLTSRLGLSRPTARQAIQELVKKGLLVRKRGVGTQVVRSQFRRSEALSSLNEDIAKAGKVPSTRLLEFSIGALDQDIRDAIDAAAVSDTEFTKIRRLRLADDVPLAILTNYLPIRFEITEDDLRSKSLYACLRALGVNLKIAHQQISARLMTEEEAELLDEETPAACLTVDRLAYDDVGQFVEFGRHVYHAMHYSIPSSAVGQPERPPRFHRAPSSKAVHSQRSPRASKRKAMAADRLPIDTGAATSATPGSGCWTRTERTAAGIAMRPCSARLRRWYMLMATSTSSTTQRLSWETGRWPTNVWIRANASAVLHFCASGSPARCR